MGNDLMLSPGESFCTPCRVLVTMNPEFGSFHAIGLHTFETADKYVRIVLYDNCRSDRFATNRATWFDMIKERVCCPIQCGRNLQKCSIVEDIEVS